MKNETKKIGVIGHFAFGRHMTDGQTVKTVTVTEALEERFGSDEVLKADTHGGAKTLLKMPFIVVNMLKKANNIIILPAQRGLRIIVPLLVLFNHFYHRRLHYCVIGGWLPSLLQNRPRLVRQLGSFCGLYVETSVVKNALNGMGISNVWLTPNCKRLAIVPESELQESKEPPFKLCTFSRVLREKGIEDAVTAVKNVNAANGSNIYSLDIYGQVADDQTEWFEQLKASFPSCIRYRGVVPFDQSGAVLKDYYALLFPTLFFTEGVPGTIIDAYAAGVPVIASRWQSCTEIVADGVTGYIYDFKDEKALESALTRLYRSGDKITELKRNCLKKAADYQPDAALKDLFSQIENRDVE